MHFKPLGLALTRRLLFGIQNLTFVLDTDVHVVAGNALPGRLGGRAERLLLEAGAAGALLLREAHEVLLLGANFN